MQKKSSVVNILDFKLVGGFISIHYIIMLYNIPLLSIFSLYIFFYIGV